MKVRLAPDGPSIISFMCGAYNLSMKYRVIAALLLLALFASMTLLGAPKKPPAPKVVAPETLAHPNAMFLASLSNGGTRRVTFKAAANGTRFFLEESAGVTVYVYDGHDYRRDTFLKQLTLEKAMKAYAKKR
jgi:hypothetical protein